MIILGIETSCDETALCLIEIEDKDTSDALLSVKVLGNELISQIKLHEQYGGVFPMLAKREHAKNLIPLFKKLLEKANLLNSTSPSLPTYEHKNLPTILAREPELLKQFLEFIPTIEKPKIDAIAVTEGPGLEPALWVGINFAMALSAVWGIPIVPVNHMEGHIISALMQKKKDSAYEIASPDYPALALLISGGHTELVLVKKIGDYEIIGRTRDDAVGEAFDKVARILGLPYPGGPQISKLAEEARKNLALNAPIPFPLPRPMIQSDDYDFSFSGLKTAALYTVKKIPEMTDAIRTSIALEFENAATEVLVAKTKKAIENFGVRSVLAGGGVTANTHIRKELLKMIKEFPDVVCYIAPPDLSTDNALMIATAGYFKKDRVQEGKNTPMIAKGNLSLDS